MRRLCGVVALAGLAGLLVGGCGGQGGEAAPAHSECAQLEIVVSTSILADVVGNVAAGLGSVEVLMPVGADPHSFQVSASRAAALRRADLVVVNGLGLEEGMADAIDGAAADGVRVRRAVAGSGGRLSPGAAGPGR